jgi:enoyl-CoA hydratase
MIDASLLADIIREPNWADSAGEVGLCVDLTTDSFSDDDVKAIGQWLSRQPVPVIGLVGHDERLRDSVDLLVTTNAEADQLLTEIRKYPKASAVLVQVTRATASLPVAAALTVESLGYATLQGGEEFSRWLEQRATRRTDAGAISEPVTIERTGNELRIKLNTPENRNALSVPMRDGLSEAFKLVAMDDSIEQVHVSGSGPSFSAGGDLSEFGTTRDLSEAHRIRQLKMPAQYLALHAQRYRFDLHGACIGAGIELPAFAGHLAATRDAFFRLPEVAMGLIPGAGGCVSIPRRIGRHRTNYLAISGTALSAADALSWGLIDELID